MFIIKNIQTVKIHALDGKVVYRFTERNVMGYIHCCGGLRKTRTFRLSPAEGFVLSELDYLYRCPVCGHTIAQITRIDKDNNVSVVRQRNNRARKLIGKVKSKIIYEESNIDYSKTVHGKFYLYYNEFGVKKRCYSNLTNLKIGLKSLI